MSLEVFISVLMVWNFMSSFFLLFTLLFKLGKLKKVTEFEMSWKILMFMILIVNCVTLQILKDNFIT